MSLNEVQKQRYLRNIILPEIGELGQEKLLNSRVLVVGAGGLGSSAILYLSAAGVGTIGIVDSDIVEISNLQRQIIHNSLDLGKRKIDSAKAKIAILNSDVNVKTYPLYINKDNLVKVVKDYDFILDATDNFPTRFVINEVCHQQKKVLIFAAVKGFSGQVSVFKSYLSDNPCYCCFNCNIVDKNFSLPLSEKGILGSIAGSIGALQSSITIKEILSIGTSLVGKILISDVLENSFRTVVLKKNPKCVVCS